jgi:hypothetical protein
VSKNYGGKDVGLQDWEGDCAYNNTLSQILGHFNFSSINFAMHLHLQYA